MKGTVREGLQENEGKRKTESWAAGEIFALLLFRKNTSIYFYVCVYVCVHTM